jgi:hypothetical protein
LRHERQTPSHLSWSICQLPADLQGHQGEHGGHVSWFICQLPVDLQGHKVSNKDDPPVAQAFSLDLALLNLVRLIELFIDAPFLTMANCGIKGAGTR